MKIALLGKGKTGGHLLNLIIEKNIPHTVFDSKNQPTLESLKGHDVVVSFLTGEVFKEYIPLLIDSKIPVVTGSTGITYDDSLKEKLISQKTAWIYATNFSLGMNLIFQMIKVLSRADKILSGITYSMHEVHHTKKLDSPSGTALSWKKWLGHDLEINSERFGDVIGLHELKLTTKTEEILISHNALDRKIFAEGALFATTLIKNLNPGLYQFQDLVQSELLKE